MEDPMGSTLKRRSVASVVFAFLAIGGALAIFGIAAWAGRAQKGSEPDLAFRAGEIEFAKRRHPLTGYPRPEGLSPLGTLRPVWDIPSAEKERMVETALGWVDPGSIAELRSKTPGLAGNPGRRLQDRGRRGELGVGLNAIQISAAALQGRSIDSIQSALQDMGVKIHEAMPHRGLLVEVPKDAIGALASADFLEAAMPYEAALRIDPMLGRTPMIERARAASMDLRIVVASLRGTDPKQALADLEKVAGTGKVKEFSTDGDSFETTVHHSKVAHIARLPWVRYVSERPEYMLQNVETPTVAMVGNIKENLPFQKPYHDVGVDGGGLNASGLPQGRRVNDGTAAVPPQIVAVTDNGLSYDSIQFSQTATQVTTTPAPLGPAHRKVHYVQGVVESGFTCDGTLSGGTTHGNVVAGTIAGNGSELGARVSKHIYNIRPRVDNLEMDGVARSARILMQDAGLVSVCTEAELFERGGNVNPGSLTDRLNAAICPKTPAASGLCSIAQQGGGGGEEVHLHVMPFGVPNFDNLLANSTIDGLYTADASNIDTFLMNNRDYMVFAPVGNQGMFRTQYYFSSFGSELRAAYPVLFNGTETDNDPNFPSVLQVSPPATAKNLVSVGSHFQDVQTAFGINQEENPANFSSKGPATIDSLRTAPIIMGVGGDSTGFFFSPNTVSAAVWKSKDNDNLEPVDAVLDDINFGSSFAAAEIAGVAALIRDYFAQGFYPTGTRVTTDRIPNVSGPLVKAAIVASANFLDQVGTNFAVPGDRQMASARGLDRGSDGTKVIGIMGNCEQGYGRPVLTSVLPLANWPTSKGIGTPDTIEYPSPGLLIFDELGTSEPAINNTTRTFIDHQFTVDGDTSRTVTVIVASGSVQARAVDRGQLRVALAWSDPPSGAGTAGLLINDLDLDLEWAGPDNNFATTTDNLMYDGNNYQFGGVKLGQWGKPRLGGQLDIGDFHNPVEAIHLSADPNGDGNPADSQLLTGTWRARVKKGSGGATAGSITLLTGAVEDDNHNGRLDAGEDSTASGGDNDGRLDADGQPFGLVIAGPVFGPGAGFPNSVARLDKSLYTCADQVRLSIFDPGTTASAVGAAVTFEVITKAGAVIDSEVGFVFTAGAGTNSYLSPSIPLREGKPAIRSNGVLETDGVTADEPYFVRARYTDTPREAQASSRISCSPNLLAWRYQIENYNFTQQTLIAGGCDGDQFMDAGENVTYSVTFVNGNTDHDLTDVQATLLVSGLCSNAVTTTCTTAAQCPAGGTCSASAVRVLNSPQNLGRIPGGQFTSATFALRIDGAALPAATAARIVDMTVRLEANNPDIQLSRQEFKFRHALNSDEETFHYSTDYPSGGREIRDFNRNLQIDKPDMTDPFIGIVLPDEDVNFSTLFLDIDPGAPVRITNMLGEDIDGDLVRDSNETDLVPNGALDGGILRSCIGGTEPGTACAVNGDCNGGGTCGPLVPWNFDTLGGGGYQAFRYAFSRPGGAAGKQPWEHVRTGVCGFQSAIPDGDSAPGFQNLGAGIWHTGDGSPTTPGTTCEDHLSAGDLGTPAGTEFIQDFLISPVVAKVHQVLDDRGLPYTAEFQRLGFNLLIQTADENAGLNFNLDNNADDDTGNCLMCQEFDFNYGGIDYQVGTFKNTGYGIDPRDLGLAQRTFGPTEDNDLSLSGGGGSQHLTGDETGFTAFTQNTHAFGIRIPVADNPDFIPYPIPLAPTVFSPFPGTCPGGGSPPCPWTNDARGPVRNVDFTLINYEAGFISPVEGPGGPTSAVTPFTVNPGVRWLIGFGFWNLESPGGATADYGAGVDDVVLEWDERHPLDETAFIPPHTPACQRFGQPGQAAGQQCATLSVDRTALYECDEAVTVTVNDQKRIGAGSVQVLAASESDSRPVSTGVITAQHPVKTFTLLEVAPGIFSGNVTVTQTVNTPNLLFVSAAGDTAIQFYYQDPLCDGNANGTVAQNDFNNLDGDGVAFSVDNCPFDYNPGVPQLDSDADGLGNICDNCPNNANGPLAPLNQLGQPIDNQRDSDGDGVGDRCDLDDVDFDGVVNAVDNCWDVYNPLQTVSGGQGERGTACEDNNFDRDGDILNDKFDNCVRTYNPSQQDRDGDGIGDACDGDCVGAREELLNSYCLQSPSTSCTTSTTTPPCTCILRGSCSRSSAIRCAIDSQCPTTGFCDEKPSEICTTSTPQCTCVLLTPETCQRRGIVNGVCQEALPTVTPCSTNGPGCTCISSCGLIDDDTDTDAVTDTLDNCPVLYNLPIIPGTTRQADTDNDGVGDACDSAFMVDGDNNGIPDDAVSFGLVVNCGNLPLPNLVIEVVTVHDLCPEGVSCQYGDGDVFCDTGEKCEMTLKVRNAGPVNLTDVTFHLATPDSDIACVSKPSVLIGSFPAGALVDTANIGGQRRPFEYTVSQTTNTIDPAIPQKADFVLNLTSREALGTSRKVDFQTLLDLDLPSGVNPIKVVGPDGTPNTPDDGQAFEDFDQDRDSNGAMNLSDGRAGIPNDITFGLNEVPARVVGTAPSSVGDTLSGIGCAGFNIPPADPNCSIETDNDMDWHIHCLPGSGAACPPPAIASGGTHSITPTGGQMAHSGQNSLHWGRHVNSATRLGDTTSFRALASFMSSPINLTPLPVSGDLILSFYHIADMVDNNEAEKTGFKPGNAVDFGDVQVQVDLDADPNPVSGNRWGNWEKLVPFENAYTHTPYIWSFWGARVTYCNVTPTDTGAGAPAPRGVRETLCRPQGVWSHCGNAWGTDTTFGCPGPGVVGTQAPASGALWVQSRFSLANFLGARIRIRWIAQGFEFDPFGTVQDYVDYGRGWDTMTTDDGWWVDDIKITGVITDQISPLADGSPVPASTCPASPDGNCNQGVGDRGFTVSLAVSDTNNNSIFEKGEKIELDAIQTANPGGCVGGVTQFKFLKNGAIVQDFSANSFFHDSPLADATYQVLARCSSDTTCTTLNGLTQSVQVYPGDGTDVLVTVTHNRSAVPPLTTISWAPRPQLPPMSGYDAFLGSGTTGTTPRDLDYTTLVQLACNLTTPVGPNFQVTTTDAPVTGTAHYYMVGHSSPVAGAQTALGRQTSGAVRLSPVAVSCP
jgi:subtilase family protein/thrombospondin type 3 repeat protein